MNPDQLPANSTVVDLGDATLLPGLMDMHIHLMDEPGADWIRERAYETQATWALRAARNARLALLNGFTTVRDLGSSGFVDVSLMDAIDRGWVDGPRIFPVGHYITSTGGHCDLTGSGRQFAIRSSTAPNGSRCARRAEYSRSTRRSVHNSIRKPSYAPV
jgi:imidazolonepropionase-like amidohydrolase